MKNTYTKIRCGFAELEEKTQNCYGKLKFICETKKECFVCTVQTSDASISSGGTFYKVKPCYMAEWHEDKNIYVLIPYTDLQKASKKQRLNVCLNAIFSQLRALYGDCTITSFDLLTWV